MKPGILTQIMVVPVTGMTIGQAFEHAFKMDFKMFSFNGVVYSTYVINKNKQLNNLGQACEIYKDAALFVLSDLVDYRYNTTS